MATSMDPLDLLRENGLRATSQRIEILQAVIEAEGHPTAEEVWERAREAQPTLSLSTVYDTLSRFVELDLLDELHAGEEATRYEFFDRPHLNLVCTACGRVEDTEADGLASLISEAEGASTFDVAPQPIELEGRCSDCQPWAATTWSSAKPTSSPTAGSASNRASTRAPPSSSTRATHASWRV